MTLGELIEKLGGRLVQGDPQWVVYGVGSCEHATAFDLAFADAPAAVAKGVQGNAGVLVVRPGAASSYPHGKNIVEVDQPRLWFARAAKRLAAPHAVSGVHPAAVVAPDAILAPGVSVGPGAVIESHVRVGERTRIEAGAVVGQRVQIGAFCHIYPRVVIYAGTSLGDRVIVHAGAVLGADGFGYVRDEKTGRYTQFPQQGTVAIEDDVEIGANSTIDRGALAETRVGRGTKIDNLVHIGHNCDIGEDVVLAALIGISGSSSVGDGAVIAGQAGIGDHVHIGPGVILGGQSGVFNGKSLTNEHVKPGTVFFGTPARPLKQVLREQATLARLAKRQGREPGTDSGQ